MAMDFGMRKAPPPAPLEHAALIGESATAILIRERDELRLQVATLTMERDQARANIMAFNVQLKLIDGLIREAVAKAARSVEGGDTPPEQIAQRFATEAPPPSNGEPPSTVERPRQKRTPLPDPTQDMRPSPQTLMERLTA